MTRLYNPQAPKKAVNLSVNSDLLIQAKQFNINLSATLEKALSEEVRKSKEEAWLEENKDSIEEYNQRIAKHGLFSEHLRLF